MKKYEEYKFKIQAYTPDTLPMERCASYMAELANMLGETPYVHFVKITKGCTQLVHKIDIEAIPKIMGNTEAVKNGTASEPKMKAYRRLNVMLREDNGTGVYVKGRDKIIRFPGKEEKIIQLPSVQQRGIIDGELIRLGGIRDIVPITLGIEGKEIPGYFAKREIAKQLAKFLFEPVRLYGEGRWERSEDGTWKVGHFVVDHFIVLEQSSLTETVATLREIAQKGSWGDNAVNELLLDRNSDNGEVN